jgi:hypothetical protein
MARFDRVQEQSERVQEHSVKEQIEVTLALDSFARESIEEEAARLGVLVEELVSFAILYYLADLDSGRIARQVSRSPYPDTATRQARSTGPRDGRDGRRRPAPHTGETGRVARGLVLGRDDPPRGRPG